MITNAPSGPHQLLEIIGRDQVTLAGRWPNISYDIDVLPAIDNNLGRPLFLPKVNDGIAMPLDSNNVITQDTTYELPVVGGEPPIRVTARAGTHVTFPPDATDKRLSVTRIATNRVPMALEDGRAASLYISVQPAGAIFDPPLAVTFPNLDGQPANTQVLLMSFDHDAGRYIRVGTGRVSADGKTVTSETGSGIRIGAWHSFPGNQACPEVITLGHIQIAGNPAFEGKAIVSSEAWVEGVRAVPMANPDLASSMSILDYRASLSLPCGRNVLVKMEATTELVVARILPRYIDHDDPANETDKPLTGFGTLYGGTERSTSDILTLHISSLADLPSRSFAWSVSGPGAGVYTPPAPGASARSWSVGEIKPVPGTLLFQVVVELTDGRRFRLIQEIEIGIRTDDVIVVGWINPDGVTLPSGAASWVTTAMPPQGPSAVNFISSCNAIIGDLSKNSSRPGVMPASESMTAVDRDYILKWMFKWGSNKNPATKIPGGDFRDAQNTRIDEDEVNNFRDTRTNYKLFNRLQIKYRPFGSGFREPRVIKGFKTAIGTTENPCHEFVFLGFTIVPGLFPGQRGPADNKVLIDLSRVASINDGSPDDGAVRAFNTLTGKDLPEGQTPVFWEDIGSQIKFKLDGSTSPEVIVQPYPTYFIYKNGRFAPPAIPQALTPLGNFQQDPYPFGKVHCSVLFGIFGVTPGGRCGDATNPNSSARTPDYVKP